MEIDATLKIAIFFLTISILWDAPDPDEYPQTGMGLLLLIIDILAFYGGRFVGLAMLGFWAL